MPTQKNAAQTCADAVDDAITSRRAVRAFLPRPVPREEIEAILRVARWAPSGSNTQPWKVYVLTEKARDELAALLLEAYDDPVKRESAREEYDYYPRNWVSPFQERRRKVGWDLYGLLGIGRADKAAMHKQLGRNFSFFDAPVALMFTVDRTMELGSWLDMGMFLQNIMIAAQGRGIATCPQAAFNKYHRVIATYLGLPENEQLVCGMSMGYRDPDATANQLVTEREPLEAFVNFVGEPAASHENIKNRDLEN